MFLQIIVFHGGFSQLPLHKMWKQLEILWPYSLSSPWYRREKKGPSSWVLADTNTSRCSRDKLGRYQRKSQKSRIQTWFVETISFSLLQLLKFSVFAFPEVSCLYSVNY